MRIMRIGAQNTLNTILLSINMNNTRTGMSRVSAIRTVHADAALADVIDNLGLGVMSVGSG